MSTAQGELVAKFASGVVDTGGKFATGVVPPVSLTPVANLSPVSTAQGELVAKFASGVVDTGGKFATGVVDIGGAPWLANISANFFEKIWNDPTVIFRGFGEGDSWKKPEAKNLVTLSL
jgi:hypothetical protein